MISHPVFRIVVCKQCRSPQVYRRPRSLLERLRYRYVYRCKSCGARTGIHHWELWNWCSFEARCVKCGNPNLKVLKHRDKIDPVSRFPISLIQRLFGAPILYCQYCRLQFYDFRRVAKSQKIAEV
jgi:hypothetical protein